MTNDGKSAGKARNEGEATARVEAALYAAGRPLSMDELVRASGLSSKIRTTEILDGITRRTRRAFTALEVARLPDGSYVLQLKPEYAGTVRKFAARPLIPRATLKTLSYIAYMQPVSSKQLVETRGSGVYAHIKELSRMEFITHQDAGRHKIYTTTEKFGRYFGTSGDADNIKRHLFAKMKNPQTTL